MDSMHRSRDFLSPLTTFNHLEGNVENHGSIDEESFSKYYRFLELVREEYKERAIEDVRHALAYDMDEIQRQGEKYMDHVMAYIDDATVEDELTGREQDPDEKFLRSVEEKLDIPEDRKDDFRQEVSNWVSRRAREGQAFDPQDNDRLRRALERKLWEDKKHNINFSALVRQRTGRRRAKRVGRRPRRAGLLATRAPGSARVRWCGGRQVRDGWYDRPGVHRPRGRVTRRRLRGPDEPRGVRRHRP